MINLNYTYFTKKKEKNKHLSKEMYEKIQSEYNYYIFNKNNTISKTKFMESLADTIGTTLSNLYTIIKDGLITTLSYNYEERLEFSSEVAFQKRTKKSIESNSSKRLSAKPFIDLIIKEFRSSYNINSIDEIIGDLKINRKDEIKDLTTICTATFYNYVEKNIIDGFDKHELPMKCKRKKKNDRYLGKTKPKGDSIENRPFSYNDRSEFGHWEGDTIVGSSIIPNSGAILTLVERKTRFQITIKMKDRKANTVYNAFKRIKKYYPDFNPKNVFKTITFDNGVEFSKWENIEKLFDLKTYFAHPYCSHERGSNENGNRLLRFFFPKGCNINEYDNNYLVHANDLINTKTRKILGYKSSLDIFFDELTKLTQST